MTQPPPLVADPHLPRPGDAARPVVDVAVGVLLRQGGDFLLTTRPAGKVYAGYWNFPAASWSRAKPSSRRWPANCMRNWASM